MLTQRNFAGKIISMVSVFKFAQDFSDRLDACPFVLGMRSNGTSFMVREKTSLCITAPGAWVGRWIDWGGCGAAWSRCWSVDTDSPYVRMGEEQFY